MELVIVAAILCLATAGALPQNYGNPYLSSSPSPFYNPYSQPTPYRTRSGAEGRAAILRSDAEVNDRGYHFAYNTDNGIQVEESGVEANGIQAQGSYSYTGADGQVYSVRYTAGVGGFQPVGAHLPTPPPLPEAIARALQENARDEANGVYDDGSYQEGKYDDNSGVVVARGQYFNRNQYNRQY